MNQLKKLKIKVHGTHCASCEVLIERKFKKLDGVEKVRVSYGSGKAEVFASHDIPLRELQEALRGEQYSVGRWEDRDSAETAQRKNSLTDYFEIGGAFLALVSLYYILRQFDLLPAFAISEGMGYGVVFLIGLVAAFSTCIAVVGGLLLAVAEKWSEMHPELSGIQKFRPHIYFNLGRVAGYTVFGAAVGGLGSVLTLSPQVNGYLVIAVSFVMLLLGFQLLHLFPGLRRFSPKMPKFIAHRVHDLSTKDSKAGPFVLGGATFFLPCGFTQALQLYVLATGDWKVGAITMLVFSLGTLPALVSLSAITSFAKGAFQRVFMKFAGALVILLAVFNINNGMTLAGVNVAVPGIFGSSGIARAETTPITDGKQIVRMVVNGYGYSPNRFTVTAGIPVEWQIDGRDAAGCGQVLVMPTIGVTKYLSKDAVTTVRFTPTEAGEIPFNCSMGMMTRGSAFTVVPNMTGAVAASAISDSAAPECDPSVATCPPKPDAQKFALTVTNERGFYPSTFTVKKGKPVEVEIDAKVPLGGCMSVMVVAPYDVTLPLKPGKQTLAFTPTKEGTVYATCSMGIEMLQFNVVSS